MHTYALIAAHVGVNIHTTALATLWSIILAATIVGATISGIRIVHGLRHVHLDVLQAARGQAGPSHTFHARSALAYQPHPVVSA